MYFIIRVEFFDEEDAKLKKHINLVWAESYENAVARCVSFYGNQIECFNLVEAITDNSVIVLTDMAEAEIRGHECNIFF